MNHIIWIIFSGRDSIRFIFHGTATASEQGLCHLHSIYDMMISIDYDRLYEISNNFFASDNFFKIERGHNLYPPMKWLRCTIFLFHKNCQKWPLAKRLLTLKIGLFPKMQYYCRIRAKNRFYSGNLANYSLYPRVSLIKIKIMSEYCDEIRRSNVLSEANHPYHAPQFILRISLPCNKSKRGDPTYIILIRIEKWHVWTLITEA